MACCFFGHHDAPDTIRPKIVEQVKEEIQGGETTFFVGNHGHYDHMVLSILRAMKEEYPHIDYSVVLAYVPNASSEEYSYLQPEETVCPEGLESIPKRFAISWCNDWMLKKCDTVIAYAQHHFGGAGKFTEKAIKQKKRVINLAENGVGQTVI